MSSTNPPQPFPLNPIYNSTDWFSGLKVNFSLQELQQYFLLKGGDVATGLISFSSGLVCDSALQMNGTINLFDGTNVATLDALHYTGICNNSIFAVKSEYIFITPTIDSQNFLIPFTNVDTPTNGYLALQTTNNGKFRYNPNIDQLQVGTISFSGGGSINGTSYSGSISSAVLAQTITVSANASNVNYGITFATTGTGPKDLYNASTNNFYYNPSTQTCAALNFSGNFIGTASAANQVNITTSTSNSNFYIPFMNSNISGARTLFGDTGNNLMYNPSTDLLTVPNLTVSGTLNATLGTSTNANNILVSTNNNNINYNLTMVASSSTGLYQSLIADSTEQLLYNPSTNTLSLGGTSNGAINLTGTASNISIASTATAINATSALVGLNARAVTLNTTQSVNNATLIFNDITTTRKTSIVLNNTTGTDSFLISPSIDNAISLNFGGQNGGTVLAYTNIFSYAVNSQNFYIGNGASPSLTMNISTTDVLFPKPINVQASIRYPTTTNLATYAGTTMTLTGPIYNVSIYNFYYNFTGTTNTITTFIINNMPTNGEWQINLYNGGTGNLNLNINALGAGFIHPTSGNLNINSLGYCTVLIQRREFNLAPLYVVNATILV